jgi:hypothetical protein
MAMKPMSPSAGLAVSVVALLALFLVSLPGLGIETRSFTSYASWAAPIFLGFTLVIFAGGIAALGLLRSRPWTATHASDAAGIAAIVTVALDTSHVGGLPPPTGPLILGIVVAIVGAFVLYGGYRLRAEACDGESCDGEDAPQSPTPT